LSWSGQSGGRKYFPLARSRGETKRRASGCVTKRTGRNLSGDSSVLRSIALKSNLCLPKTHKSPSVLRASSGEPLVRVNFSHYYSLDNFRLASLRLEKKARRLPLMPRTTSTKSRGLHNETSERPFKFTLLSPGRLTPSPASPSPRSFNIFTAGSALGEQAERLCKRVPLKAIGYPRPAFSYLDTDTKEPDSLSSSRISGDALRQGEGRA
jgi:hypothetical protein